MEIYCTSKNSGPSYYSDPISMVYLGTSLDEAIEAVGEFVKYEKPLFSDEMKHIYCALPKNVDFEIIKAYMADGWWYTIAKFDSKKD